MTARKKRPSGKRTQYGPRRTPAKPMTPAELERWVKFYGGVK